MHRARVDVKVSEGAQILVGDGNEQSLSEDQSGADALAEGTIAIRIKPLGGV